MVSMSLMLDVKQLIFCKIHLKPSTIFTDHGAHFQFLMLAVLLP